MDKKTKYKILGVFVAVGLVVILLPFFQNSEEVPSATALITPPPFPDQAVQVSAPAPTEQIAQTTSTASQTAEPVESSGIQTAAQTEPNSSSVVENIPSPDAVSATNTAQTAPATDVKTTEPAKAPVAAVSQPATPKTKHAKTIKPQQVKKVAKAKPKKAAPELLSYNRPMPPGPIVDDGLFALKNPAWVVQIGSFNNKANALKLVNQLRASGYRAFIQKVSTTFGENTRVFVGPEKQPESARVLANQLEDNLHLHGIVISYKPLTL